LLLLGPWLGALTTNPVLRITTFSGRLVDASQSHIDAFTAFEAAGWERQALGYHTFWGPITGRLIDPLLAAAAVAPGHTMLDVATGPGYVAARAHKLGANVVAVDIAQAMVALTRDRHPGIQVQQASAEALPFANAAFDAVVANFLVLHLSRPERAAAEMTRVLAPGGRLALTAWDVQDHMRVVGVVMEALEEVGVAAAPDIPTGPPYFRFSTGCAFRQLLEDQGLIDVQLASVAFVHRVESVAKLWDGMVHGAVRMSALITAQSRVTQERILEALHRATDRYRVGDRLELPVAAKVVSGQKPLP
jgi:SAM-dependent methyltransferase